MEIAIVQRTVTLETSVAEVFGSVDDFNRPVQDTAVAVIIVILAAFGTAEIKIAPSTANQCTTVRLGSGCVDVYNRHVLGIVDQIIGARRSTGSFSSRPRAQIKHTKSHLTGTRSRATKSDS